MMKKIVFSLLLCSSLFGLSACEDKAEKRAKLFAQLQEADKELSICYLDNRQDSARGDTSKCDDKRKIKEDIKKQLDKLNSVK